jgi:hypothetical protein
MSPLKRGAALSKSPDSASTAQQAADDALGRRVLIVLVLTPALILFMSRKDVGHAARKPATSPHVLEQWPMSGLDAMHRAGHARALAAPVVLSDPRSAGLVYARAMFFAGKYDSRPFWRRPKLEAGAPTDRATADLAIEHLIPCESMGETTNRIDVNGKTSYGILQFQDWEEWESVSGLSGDPDNREDAIRMAEWAIENGMINHWTCAQILKII